MSCGICGKSGHNNKTCVYDAKRTRLAPEFAKNKRCECCGQYGYEIQRHHTRGRGNDSDFLDLCRDCHLHCGHGGNFHNLPIKPRVCRWTEKASYWLS